MGKENVACIGVMEYNLPLKEEKLPLAICVGPEDIVLSEIIQAQKEKYCTVLLIHGS
jgi:hypothetical protein